jgi:hypothetical protein
MNGPKGLKRFELADELTAAIETLNDVKATGAALVRVATVVRNLEVLRATLGVNELQS